MNVVFLHNESAGFEDWSRAELLRLLRRAGLRPQYFDLDAALKRPEILDQGEFVIVAGGDGSVRKIALKLLGRGQALAILPLGTANNIARSLGLTDTPEKLIAGWARPRRRKFDVGIALGPWGRRYFVESMGIGLMSRSIKILSELDAVSMHEASESKDQLHRDTMVVAALAHELSPIALEFETDGMRRSGEFILAEVLNISRVGPGVQLAPDASPSDGVFDFVGVTVKQRARLITLLKTQLAQTKRPARLPVRRVRSLKVSMPAGTLHIDDAALELRRPAEIEIALQPGALELVLPSSARSR